MVPVWGSSGLHGGAQGSEGKPREGAASLGEALTPFEGSDSCVCPCSDAEVAASCFELGCWF